MSNNTWLITEITPWSRTVVPAFAAFGSVCPQHAVNATPMRKRTTDGAPAAAYKHLGSDAWSPPTG